MSTWGPHRRGIVYFAFGLRHGYPAIKIGITTDVGRRMTALGARLLTWQDGDGALESALHTMFSDDALGNEWFRPAPALLDYIAEHLTLDAPPVITVKPAPRSAERMGFVAARIDPEMVAIVDALAKEANVTRSEMARRLVEEGLDSYEAQTSSEIAAGF